MLQRVRLVVASLVGAGVVGVAVCLGAQNLTDRPSLQLGVARSAPLPSGFLLGMALAAGLLSGGGAVAVAFAASEEEEKGSS
ncbi:MAG: hypothetical protein VKP70_12395 [Cyanobacteriota bacterium]|nr:hypothetical protein [Cyanobacteriota bacterium]